MKCEICGKVHNVKSDDLGICMACRENNVCLFCGKTIKASKIYCDIKCANKFRKLMQTGMAVENVQKYIGKVDSYVTYKDFKNTKHYKKFSDEAMRLYEELFLDMIEIISIDISKIIEKEFLRFNIEVLLRESNWYLINVVYVDKIKKTATCEVVKWKS
ncbi:hypothetical protein [Fundidesulfovibrio putealis]|uniref:hypothetical protein n=1 Tax=Fundidesulfovibrio putealis TaxID=270496 RepID=UPI0012EBB8E9|nr:hypothetical protein [Fundidesulfovibrio putealis]